MGYSLDSYVTSLPRKALSKESSACIFLYIVALLRAIYITWVHPLRDAIAISLRLYLDGDATYLSLTKVPALFSLSSHGKHPSFALERSTSMQHSLSIHSSLLTRYACKSHYYCKSQHASWKLLPKTSRLAPSTYRLCLCRQMNSLNCQWLNGACHIKRGDLV